MPANCPVDDIPHCDHVGEHLADTQSNLSYAKSQVLVGRSPAHVEDPEDRSESLELRDMVLEGLRKGPGCKELSFRFLYDEKGSELYGAITRLEEYYPFDAECQMMTQHADSIAALIPEGCVVVELGCGSASKTVHLLNAVIARHGRCRFVGIDVSQSFLDEARCNLMQNVQGHLILDLLPADFLAGLRQVRSKYPKEPLCLLWLGSGVGNISQDRATSFLQDVFDTVKSRCRFFLCTDMWKRENILRPAYDDKKGVTEAFIKNGMRNALHILGYEASAVELQSWAYDVVINGDLQQVEMYVKFPNGFNLPEHHVMIRPGERVLMEISRKFSMGKILQMSEGAGFHVHSAWRNQNYGGQLLLDDADAITQSWQDTDTFFDSLADWTVKPIESRHAYCFYYGHLSSFMKMKLLPDETVSEMDLIFSRGMDPNLLDPTKCHGHPETPDKWAKKEKICEYVNAIRHLVLEAQAAGKFKGISKLITFVLEHGWMHLETLSYMVAQETKMVFENTPTTATVAILPRKKLETIEPANTESIISSLAKANMIAFNPGPVVLGADPSQNGFLWDNEYPQLHTSIATTFWVSSKPVSIGQFYTFVMEGGYNKENLWDPRDFVHFKLKGFKYPATWSLVESEFYVHGLRATNHWSKVADQPVFVSLSEAQAFCKWMGCRVLTESEYQRVLDVDPSEELVHQMRSGGWEWTSSLFQPFPGFEPMSDYPEYSADFYDGIHFVLKGSSSVTHSSMKRDSFRNFYQGQYRYVFAKFRCCR